MSMLLNRKYGSRLECLYYILCSKYERYGTTEWFSLGDLKYDDDDEYNVHKHCGLLIECIGIKCCPFLQNPLNNSKCYATQSVNSDSTKSKAVSDIGGSLEALGFIIRNQKKFKISKEGERWVKSSFGTAEWEEVALEGVLSYGLVIGFLSKIRDNEDLFSYSGIYMSYPQTDEVVRYKDDNGDTVFINISTDSRRDSNTRTMSRIIGWCVAVGLLEPQVNTNNANSKLAHIKYRDFINRGELTVRTYKKTELCKNIFSKKRVVMNPLAFSRLHKNVGSLRENGGGTLRRATMEHEKHIRNRRFAFVYILNKYSQKNEKLSFSRLISAMKEFESEFFSPGNVAEDIMSTEIEIADIAGIPFDVEGDYLIPLTTINEEVLLEDAEDSAIDLANEVLKKLGGI